MSCFNVFLGVFLADIDNIKTIWYINNSKIFIKSDNMSKYYKNRISCVYNTYLKVLTTLLKVCI